MYAFHEVLPVWFPLLLLRLPLSFLCLPLFPFGRHEPLFQVLGPHPRRPPRPIPPQFLNCLLYLVLRRYLVIHLHRFYCNRNVLSRGWYVAVEVDPLRRDPL